MNQFERINRLFVALTGALLLSASYLSLAADLTEANQLFRKGQYAQALEKTDAFLADKPKDAQARFLKGLILTEQGKVPDAVSVFSALTEDYPELPEPYNNLAVLYASQGEYDKARLSLEKAIRTHPSYSTAHENLGDIYAKMASQAYDRALQLDRGNTAMQTKLAMIQDLFDSNKQVPAVQASQVRQPSETVKVAGTPIATPPEPVKPEPAKPAPAKTAPAEPKPAQPVVAKTEPVTQTPATVVAKEDPSKNLTEILNTVNAWAAAWSAQNVKEYLSYYAADFRPEDDQTLEEWRSTRSARVSFPKSIKVAVGKPTVIFDDNERATVKFRQTYRASHLKSTNSKTLVMVKNDGKWRIQMERSK